MGPNVILDANNDPIVVTGFNGLSTLVGTSTLTFLPLGTPGDSTTGPVGIKVVMVGSGTSSTIVQGTAADNAVSVGNPVYVGGLAVAGSTYAPAYTAGDAAALAVDKDSGGLLVHMRTLTTSDAITNTPIGYSFLNITTATTTTVKSGAGVFVALIYNKPLINATATIYDNTAASGTKIGTITLPAALTSDTDVMTYNAAFSTGLTIVTTTASDITVIYR